MCIRDRNKVDNYFIAIKYQLETIENMILNENSDSIFILFGDHQPPVLTNHKNSFNTPIHIISKNIKFIENWHKKGFFDTLFIENQKGIKELNHYDFKKMFIDSFLKNYQKNDFL